MSPRSAGVPVRGHENSRGVDKKAGCSIAGGDRKKSPGAQRKAAGRGESERVVKRVFGGYDGEAQ